MGGANVVSFKAGPRVRGAAGPRLITEAELRERQGRVPLDDCHAALERVSVQIALKVRKFTLFHDLSAVFPKGRRIAVLGHKGAGKTTLFDLLLRMRMPNRGAVLARSRLSFPIHRTDFIDQRLTARDNLIFASRVLGVDARRITHAAQRYCDLDDRQMRVKVKELSPAVRRRMGLVVAIAADFDCHLVDGQLNMKHYDATGAEAEALERVVFGRDYIFATSNAKHVPDTCDLAYLLYDGRLYYFDDVAVATEVFATLPVPEDPGAGQRKKQEDDDDEFEEQVF